MTQEGGLWGFVMFTLIEGFLDLNGGVWKKTRTGYCRRGFAAIYNILETKISVQLITENQIPFRSN